jgi:hypothetical protein
MGHVLRRSDIGNDCRTAIAAQETNSRRTEASHQEKQMRRGLSTGNAQPKRGRFHENKK